MGFLSRVVEGLRGAGTPAPPTVQIVTSEAIDLPDIRNDDHDRFFSTLLGAGASRFNLRRAAEVSAAVAERNPMARRILRLDLDYTIGSQITASPKLPNDQDERQAEIDAELRRTGAAIQALDAVVVETVPPVSRRGRDRGEADPGHRSAVPAPAGDHEHDRA
jgi:hypothetical protein